MQVFHRFSKSIVKELLSLGKEEISYVEKRAEVLSITNGEFTLEMSDPCPPNCDEF